MSISFKSKPPQNELYCKLVTPYVVFRGSVCLIRCPWQSAEQSHRCSAWNGARRSHSSFGRRVRGGHWSDAVKTGSSEELRWTATVQSQFVHSNKDNSAAGFTVLSIVSASYIIIISHNQSRLTLCYWQLMSLKGFLFIERLVYSARREGVSDFCLFIIRVSLGKSLLSKIKQEV